MVLPSLLASPPSSGNSPSSRLLRSRGGGGGGGRGTVISPPSRPPVLLQITADDDVVLAGTVAHAAPQRIVVPSVSSSSSSSQLSGEALYRLWAPLLQHVYDSLGQDTKDRRVVVLLPDATVDDEYVVNHDEDTTRRVLVRILLDLIGVPSVSLQSALSLVPYGFPMLSTMLVVHVSDATSEACTFVHSHDRNLAYTLHSVPFRHPVDAKPSRVSADWTTTLERRYLDATDPHSVLTALLRTLQACPLPIRGRAIRNIVVCGDGVVLRPDAPVRLARRLREILRSGVPRPATGRDSSSTTPERDDDDEGDKTTPDPYSVSMVPVDLTALRALAPSVGLVDIPATLGAPYRPDLLAWIGATIWASHSHQHNPDAFAWISSKTEEERA